MTSIDYFSIVRRIVSYDTRINLVPAHSEASAKKYPRIVLPHQPDGVPQGLVDCHIIDACEDPALYVLSRIGGENRNTQIEMSYPNSVRGYKSAATALTPQ